MIIYYYIRLMFVKNKQKTTVFELILKTMRKYSSDLDCLVMRFFT